MVDAEQIEYCGVDVVDVNRLFHGLEAEIVGRAVDRATFYGSPGEPHRKSKRIMIAAALHRSAHAAANLAHGGAAELRTANHQRIFPETALLEILDYGRESLVRIPGIDLMGKNVGMSVPRIAFGIVKLYHADAFFGKPNRSQRATRDVARSVHVERG